MFDTMTMVKAFGWLCGALLIYLLINWAGESLYAMDAGHGHGDEEVVQGYVIDTGAEEGGGDVAEEAGPSFEEVFAAADAASGERVFGKCRACHKLDGSNGTGPHLDGVVGRPVGSVGDYSYSSAMAESGGEWTPEHLSEFLADPRGVVPGTKMTFAGLRSVQERADLIAYLQGQ